MKDKLFDQLDENKKFDELTYENLKYVVDIIKDEVEEEPEINNVIIFDYMGAYLRDNHVKGNSNASTTFTYISLFFMSNI